MNAASPTQAMSAVYERHANSLEEYVRAFPGGRRGAGVLFFNAGAFGFDVFDHAETMCAVLPKLVRSYAPDAIESRDVAAPPEPPAAADFLKQFAAAPATTERAIGLGEDVRITGTNVAGAALWAEEHYVHVCGFSGPSAAGSAPRARMSRPSRRRARFSE